MDSKVTDITYYLEKCVLLIIRCRNKNPKSENAQVK